MKNKVIALMDRIVQMTEEIAVGLLDNDEYLIIGSYGYGPCKNTLPRERGIFTSEIEGRLCIFDGDGNVIDVENKRLVEEYMQTKMEKMLEDTYYSPIGEYNTETEVWNPSFKRGLAIWKYSMHGSNYTRISFDINTRISVEGVWDIDKEGWAVKPFIGRIDVKKGYTLKIEEGGTTVLDESMCKIYKSASTPTHEFMMLSKDIWIIRTYDTITVLKERGQKELGIYTGNSISLLNDSYLKIANRVSVMRGDSDLAHPSLRVQNVYNIIDINTGELLEINALCLAERNGIVVGTKEEIGKACVVTQTGKIEEVEVKKYGSVEVQRKNMDLIKNTLYSVSYSDGIIVYRLIYTLEGIKIEIASVANQIALKEGMEQETANLVREVNKYLHEMSNREIARVFSNGNHQAKLEWRTV